MSLTVDSVSSRPLRTQLCPDCAVWRWSPERPGQRHLHVRPWTQRRGLQTWWNLTNVVALDLIVYSYWCLNNLHRITSIKLKPNQSRWLVPILDYHCFQLGLHHSNEGTEDRSDMRVVSATEGINNNKTIDVSSLGLRDLLLSESHFWW